MNGLDIIMLLIGIFIALLIGGIAFFVWIDSND